MPTAMRVGPYRLFFYANDESEAPHIHVERDRFKAKFWLRPVRLQSSGGYGRAELNRIQRIVEERREELLRAWNDYFSR